MVRIVRLISAFLPSCRPIDHLPLVGSVLAIALASNVGWAQHITVDGRFSPAQTLVGPNYAIGANLGKQVGSNLFHSFGQFGLSTGESATFSGPATISNVIGRVTGGNPSAIDGKIQSTIAGANLYLINPRGIVFGPNATVNVSGSFHASTADYLRMSDGAKFQATNPDSSTLSAAAPAAFGFLNASPAAITVNGSTLGPVPGTLGLVGGPVSIMGGTLSAPAGTIHVTSAAGTGEVPADPRNMSALTVTSFGPVAVSGASTLNASDPRSLGSGGSVFIRSGALTIDASEINGDNYGSGPGGVLSLRGDHQVALSNGASVHALALGSGTGAGVTISTTPSGAIWADASTVQVGTRPRGSGNGGPLSLETGQLTLTNGAALTSRGMTAFEPGIVVDEGSVTISAGSISLTGNAQISTTENGTGAAGDITISAIDRLSVDDVSKIGSQGFGNARAGSIALTARNIDVLGGSTISSETSGAGQSGNVTLMASHAIDIDSTGSQSPSDVDADSRGRGAAGLVTMAAENIRVVGGSEITSDSFATGNFATGNSGSVSVAASGLLLLDGSGSARGSNFISATTFGSGAAGSVLVQAGKLLMLGGSQIGADSVARGEGNSGDVTVNARDIRIRDGSVITSTTFSSGNGGQVSVTADRSLTIIGTNEPLVTGIIADAEPLSSGNGGAVKVVAGELTLANRNAEIGSATFGTGNAGSVIVSAGSLSIVNGGFISSGATTNGVLASTGNAGSITVSAAGLLSMGGSGSQISTSTDPGTTGNAGSVVVTAPQIRLASGAEITSTTAGTGAGGSVNVTTPGALVLDGGGVAYTQIAASAMGSQSGPGGLVTVNAGMLTIQGGAQIASTTFGSGKAGDIAVTVANDATLSGTGPNGASGITASAQQESGGRAGEVVLTAGGAIALSGGAVVTSSTAGSGNGGTVQVTAQGLLTLTDPGTGITATAEPGSRGNAGSVVAAAPQITIASGAEIASTTAGTGMGGSITVMTSGALLLDGAGVAGTQIAASGTGPQSGAGGSVTVEANALTIEGGAQIASSTFGPGKGGDVMVSVANGVTLSGVGSSSASGITASAEPGSSGQAGEVVLTAGGAIVLSGGAKAASSTAGSGNGGTVQVTAQGPLSLTDPGTGITASAEPGSSGNAGSVVAAAPQMTIASGAEIASTTAGTGMGGSITVTTPGMLVLDGAGLAGNTEIAASAIGTQSGSGGSVTIAADALAIEGGARIASTTFGPGKAGDIAVTVANGVTLSGTGPTGASGITAAAQIGSRGQAGEVNLIAGGAIALSGGAKVTSSTAGSGNGGTVEVTAKGPLSLSDPGSGIIASATSTASGNAGSVMVGAPQIALISGAEIASATAGTGAGGSVSVTTPGALVLNGNGDANTEIAASATGPQSGPGGAVAVAANALTVEGGAQIGSSTAGPGKGGDVNVTIANDVALSGAASDGTPSRITASAQPGSSGQAGEVVLTAGGAIALSGGAEVTTSTAGVGNGGTVQVTAQGPLTLTDLGTGIIASATGTASGNAGSVTVGAPQIALISGAEIASTTAGTGAGGSVSVTTPGTLVLNGNGDPATQIATSAIGSHSGPGGLVTIAANSLTVEGGAQIAGSTAGPGKGGDVNVIVASDIVLPDPGPQITAQSTGSGDAGSITVSANRLLISDGGAISTEARTSTASGGNITLHLRDFLYLTSAEISTSVKGETGNGGNITIDPLLVILNHSTIKADAIAGHGGNITITADQFIPSSDSSLEATSELGISGTIVIDGPRVDVNGALVVLSTQLRSRTEVLREACVARAGQPVSSLVEAGRGGLPQDPEATLPALYIAGRELGPSPPAAAGPTETSGILQTTVHLTMRCG